MTATPRLALPFLSSGQAQKEVFHNEALQTLDTLVGGCVEEPPRPSAPDTPAIGACYLVDAGASGDWTGQAQTIAAFTSGGWRHIAPREGMRVYVRSADCWAAFRAGAWDLGRVRGSSLGIDGKQVVGSQSEPIPSPAGGSTVDAEARAAIVGILESLREHGLIGV